MNFMTIIPIRLNKNFLSVYTSSDTELKSVPHPLQIIEKF